MEWVKRLWHCVVLDKPKVSERLIHNGALEERGNYLSQWSICRRCNKQVHRQQGISTTTPWSHNTPK